MAVCKRFIESKKKEVIMDNSKYECRRCGYIYDQLDGDPDSNIPLGTPFEKLPNDWVCPACGAPKSQFFRKNE